MLPHILRATLLLAAATLTLAQNTPARAENQTPRDYFAPVPEAIYAGVPFSMPRVAVPKIPARSVTITDFGAVGDGKFLNTDAFARAIRHIADQGGGRVVVPRGIWLTGPIVLLSNIQLHTEAGALVLFSPDRSLYPLVETNWEGLETLRCQSPISAHRAENIAITGEGVFDGSGQAWRPVKKFKMTDLQWRKLLASGGVLDEADEIWWPSEGALAGARGNFQGPRGDRTAADYERVRDYLRPVLVSLRECRNILLDGPTFQNSPAWNIHPWLCENLILRNLTVLNPWFSQNGDGVDLDSSRHAVIYHNTFDVGDDAICLKSGKDAEGRARARPTELVVVRHNTVYHGHGGFIIGSEMSGGVRHVFAADLTFIGTNVGLRFKSNRGRGGVVEDIHITDVNMVNIPTEPIRFNLFYAGAAPGSAQPGPIDRAAYLSGYPAVTEETPAFRNITIRNVVCRGAGAARWIQGLPEMPVQNVRLENIAITATQGARLIDVAGFHFDRVRLEAAKGPLLELHNAQNLVMRDSTIASIARADTSAPVQLSGPLTRGVDLRGLAPAANGEPLDFKIAADVIAEEVQFPAR